MMLRYLKNIYLWKKCLLQWWRKKKRLIALRITSSDAAAAFERKSFLTIFEIV